MSKAFLEGRNALVTGAARGIGLSYALRLASLGANVAVTDIDLASAQQYEAEQQRLVGGSLSKTLEQFGTQSMTGQVDSADPEATKAFVDGIVGRWGSLDVVICNAGGGADGGGSEASTLDPAKMLATFQRNLFATIHTCVAASPHMKRQRSGRIVNVATFAVTTVTPGAKAADYSVAKAAVAHYTRYLAQDLASYGVNVNALAPGFIASGQFEARFGKGIPGGLDAFAAQIPLGRLGTPEDCANVMEFLVSPLSSYMTGQILGVDGGLIKNPI